MFVPRALRLKGVKEPQKPNAPKNATKAPDENMHLDTDALVEAMEKTSTTSPAPQQEQIDTKATTHERGPRFTTRVVTPEYMAQLAAGIELIFTDYAHQDEERSTWLRDRYRVVDGEQKFIHLTAILEHPNIATLKPEASQILLKQAMHKNPSKYLEISKNGYYVRRRPSTYPSPFIPEHSFNVCDDEGLSFWDQRTIYVEPHARALCQTPAKVAQWLKDNGQLKPKWLPIQAVITLWNSCAFVVLSGSVMHENIWQKWRQMEKPEYWKVLTKLEHTKRTEEYLDLLKEEQSKGKHTPNKVEVNENLSTAPLAVATDGKDSVVAQQVTNKRKRKRKRGVKSGDKDKDVDANSDNRTAGSPGEEPSTGKRRA